MWKNHLKQLTQNSPKRLRRELARISSFLHKTNFGKIRPNFYPFLIQRSVKEILGQRLSKKGNFFYVKREYPPCHSLSILWCCTTIGIYFQPRDKRNRCDIGMRFMPPRPIFPKGMPPVL